MKKTCRYKLFYKTVTVSDITELIKQRMENNLPSLMDENWKFDDITVDEKKV